MARLERTPASICPLCAGFATLFAYEQLAGTLPRVSPHSWITGFAGVLLLLTLFEIAVWGARPWRCAVSFYCLAAFVVVLLEVRW